MQIRLVGNFLRSGIIENGICEMQTEGTPQGGPLSPILSNILLDELDKIKQLKRGKTTVKMLTSRGIAKDSASKVAYSGKGWWRISSTPQVHRAMGVGWAKGLGLKSLVETYMSL